MSYLNENKIMDYLNPVMYILNRVDKPVDKYNLLKILYFADQKSLVKYNKKVTIDWYEKNEYGPVAYHTYDLLKAIEGRNDFIPKYLFEGYIKKQGRNSFKALRKVDLDDFTNIQIECLNSAIEENVNLSFKELLKKSHDTAYHKTPNLYREIDKYEIAKAGGANPEQIAHMREMDEIHNSEWV